VLTYAHAAIVEAACVNIPVPRDTIGANGLIGDPSIRTSAVRALLTLAESARRADDDGSRVDPH